MGGKTKTKWNDFDPNWQRSQQNEMTTPRPWTSEFIKDHKRWQEKALTPEKRDCILAALEIGKQSRCTSGSRQF